MSDVCKHFLEGDNLVRIFHFFCETGDAQVTDPITDVICMMVTSRIQLSVTERGVMLFKDKMSHVYPYTHMTVEQLSYVQRVVYMALEVEQKEREALGSNSQEIDFLKDTCTGEQCGDGTHTGCRSASGNVHGVQMGGGVVVLIKSGTTNARQPVVVPLLNVMAAFFQLVFASKVHKTAFIRRNICTVVAQRVFSAIYVPNETQQQIFTLLAQKSGA